MERGYSGRRLKLCRDKDDNNITRVASTRCRKVPHFSNYFNRCSFNKKFPNEKPLRNKYYPKHTLRIYLRSVTPCDTIVTTKRKPTVWTY